ncbi:MAG: hypothetical protein L3J74_14150 [Bacteroidales bacterium]|nr:hypothetical protein [Bacteroidales bacterium]
MKHLFIVAFLLFASVSSCKTVKKVKQDPRTNLETAIPDMIKMMETENYTALFNTYVYPEDLERMTQKKSLEELITNFVENGKAENLLKALKTAQKYSPVYNNTKTEAIYKKEITGLKKDLILRKLNGFWYIAN